MGRTNTVILAIGLFACIALSLMMQHVSKVQVEAQRHPVEKEVEQFFGSRLVERPAFAVETRNGVEVGVLSIRPKLAAAPHRLANSIGQLVWALESMQASRIARLEVAIQGAEGEPRIEVVQRPKIRVLSKPSAAPGKK